MKGNSGLDGHCSSHLQQDSKTRVEDDDLKEKTKKARSIKVSDFHSFKLSPMDFQFQKTSFTPVRNFMKPTSCSDARKGKLQPTVNSPVSTDKKKTLKSSKDTNSLKASSYSFTASSSPTSVRMLNRQSSLKPARSSMKKSSSTVASCAKKNTNRATCSSTLKDSKFPAALELDHGATEGEGTSKMRVCPYTYCSLNGYIHKTWPPLKCFVSARRKLLEAQRDKKTVGLLSIKSSEKEKEKIDKEQLDDFSEVSSDFFVDIYTIPQEEITVKNCDEISIQEEKDQEQDCMLDVVLDSSETMPQMNELSDICHEYGYDMDQTSEFSQDEMDDTMMNLVEYVEIYNEEYELEQCRERKNSDIDATDMDWDGGQFFGTTIKSEVAEGDSGREEGNSHVTDKDGSIRSSPDLSSESIVGKFLIPKQEGTEAIAAQSGEHNDGVVDANTSEMQSFHPLGDESNKLEKELLTSINGTAGTMLNFSTIDFKGLGSTLSSTWNISRKEEVEEFEQEKEFNPRPPNFLPLEPDPEAEKVDLRHQMMDGRKNSEEWMVDHALQQAVSRLGSVARKRKVALLVEAFETVVPLHVCEKPLSHETSAFSHLSFIQACN